MIQKRASQVSQSSNGMATYSQVPEMHSAASQRSIAISLNGAQGLTL